MLRLSIPSIDVFNEEDNTFDTLKGCVLSLEHSLVSVSKWESFWCVPFLSKREKTNEEVIDYIKCMTLTQNVDPAVYSRLSEGNIASIQEYISAPMTATVISNRDNRQSRELITSEIIYYWMVALNIPFECQKWHLNRLLMLINVCSIKQSKPKKMRGSSVLRNQAALNAARKAELGTKG